ncbi:hypothetical protein BABINDRAFT_168155 [Babjeviella inositovora NRRL Y-12698]|uniref:Uncharacterized protein n=1 Tax=Babjeviella inositovora NRRL Y-12698 TaxID=984486 RepID=A0A1E3QL82_9ASCO|nr:uncharacterized protein BABINDRAFT_168155 [Babjeviella inositovora NRRL Y-12698]ODQ78410.1 hypothetical protein BABINDRAFT_168155 [Babjeviella inositovora NRRL Y-12698]
MFRRANYAILHLLFSFLLTLYIQNVGATWYMKEAKICNPKQDNSWLPFTGIRICREYAIKNSKPILHHHALLSHCDTGRRTFEVYALSERNVDINWEKPFCMVVDPAVDPTAISKPARSLFQTLLKPWKSLTLFQQHPNAQLLAEIHTKRRGVHYTGKDYNERVSKARESSIEDVATSYMKNLRCYKLARRKKYAKRDISIYVPNTLVGGLFECPVPGNFIQDHFSNISDAMEAILLPTDFKCDPATALPIKPLLADDPSHQWLDYKLHGFKFDFVQRVPFFYSVGSLNQNPNLSPASIPGFGEWASDIEVNENYHYTLADMASISATVNQAVSVVKRLVRDMDQNWIPFEKNQLYGDESERERKMPTEMEQIHEVEDDEKFSSRKQFKTVNDNHRITKKVLHMLENAKISMEDEFQLLNYLVRLPHFVARLRIAILQKPWDEMDLSSENVWREKE